ncbi:thermonuclease family protein [Sulfitobacter guttiformis]|uniref:Endonuclease YncB(Thermonuclease family) n=1 Tax=Sulfitobacter guttiformis TaxID=74349 RepID=A0A420DK27_9RHOB|nr:thermonuclease family protein [Sulfitobacter guttiformis]KIN71619.1 Succinoglycan biosynthesis protein [Sulfitobacter guttiformis KCTC 32187]RKE94548.1 endonuclease YncB(thermonuclease family) [Sulfitobacter guttiformis]
MVVLLKSFSRRLRILFGVGVCLLGLAGSILLANESDGVITGSIRVIDGDTFEVSGVKIRLHGIDAPENDQMCEMQQGTEWACGGWITKVVTDRFSGQTARCLRIEMDRYGRTVARCEVQGTDVGAWLVSEGMAFAYVRYSADYVGIEREAAAVDRGLHAVRMLSPAQHRKNGKQRSQPQQASGECVIKGNISAKGDRIYHMPGQEFYGRTRINVAKGERWFCSEAAARAAGWRKARR